MSMKDFLFLALFVGTLSMTVTKSTIIRPFRVWIANRNELAGELVQCPFCFSHWVALIAVIVLKFRVTEFGPYIDCPVAWLALTGAGTVVSGTIYKLFAPPTTLGFPSLPRQDLPCHSRTGFSFRRTSPGRPFGSTGRASSS